MEWNCKIYFTRLQSLLLQPFWGGEVTYNFVLRFSNNFPTLLRIYPIFATYFFQLQLVHEFKLHYFIPSFRVFAVSQGFSYRQTRLKHYFNSYRCTALSEITIVPYLFAAYIIMARLCISFGKQFEEWFRTK